MDIDDPIDIDTAPVITAATPPTGDTPDGAFGPPPPPPGASAPPPPPAPPPGDGGGGDTPDDGGWAGRPLAHRLRRDEQHRMLGGVAAGLARYLDIDAVVVRVVFVALAVLGGSGILVYLAAWLLIPADEDEHGLAQQWSQRHPARRNLFAIVVGIALGVVALSDVFSSGPWWPQRHGGIGLGLGVVALVLAVALVANSGARRSAASRMRRLLVILVLSALTVVVVAAATVFTIEAVSGTPLRGGIGSTQWHPTAPAQVAPRYRLAVGTMNVDLSDVAFGPGTTHITATVGIGRLYVEVPPGPTVSVDAHSGLGAVDVFGLNNSGLGTVQTMRSVGAGTATRAHLVLDADAGVGQVEVVRG